MRFPKAVAVWVGSKSSVKSLFYYIKYPDLKMVKILTISITCPLFRVEFLTADSISWSLGLVGTSVGEISEAKCYFLEPRPPVKSLDWMTLDVLTGPPEFEADETAALWGLTVLLIFWLTGSFLGCALFLLGDLIGRYILVFFKYNYNLWYSSTFK